MSAEPTKRVGDYEIVGILGRGGMGNVFKVRNLLSDRIEAMKILLPDLANGEELADRFRREIKLLASLDHPNIAAFRTALTWDNRLVMIMEYVEGMTLAMRVAAGPLPLGDAVDYTQQVLAALAYAHARHIVHRDIKPANIMVTAQQVIKLMDFGIARSASDANMTMTGTTLGSLYYMSPEQVKGEPADERSDLYSLGITLYELVTGKRPFDEDSDYSIMAAQLNKQPKPPILLRTDLPAGLSDIIMRAVAKEPAHRFQSAAEFSQALTSLAITRQLATLPREFLTMPTATHGVFTAATKSIRAISISPGAVGSAPVEVQGQRPRSEPEPAAPDMVAVTPPGTRIVRYRGYYMSVGALIVVVVLVAAGLYLPKRNVAHSAAPAKISNARELQPSGSKNLDPSTAAPTSSGNSGSGSPQILSASPSSAASSNQGGGVPPQNAAVDGAGLRNSDYGGSTPLTAPANHHGLAVPPSKAVVRSETSAANSSETRPPSNAAAPGSLASAANTVPANPAPSTVTSPLIAVDQPALNELARDLDLLASRADGINGTLTSLRDAQRAQGLGLRGDIVSSQARMQRYLTHAQSALNDRNVSDTRKYLDLAETEATNLEKFLGR